MDGTRVGRAAADGAALELGTVLGATSTAHARDLQPPGVRAAASEEVVDGAAEVTMQPLAFGRIE